MSYCEFTRNICVLPKFTFNELLFIKQTHLEHFNCNLFIYSLIYFLNELP